MIIIELYSNDYIRQGIYISAIISKGVSFALGERFEYPNIEEMLKNGGNNMNL